jgi:hypothetical protein
MVMSTVIESPRRLESVTPDSFIDGVGSTAVARRPSREETQIVAWRDQAGAGAGAPLTLRSQGPFRARILSARAH